MKVMLPAHMVDGLLPVLRKSDPEIEPVPVTAEGGWTAGIEEAEVLFRYYGRFPRVYAAEGLANILRNAPRLRWVHNGFAGVEDVLSPELVESDVVLTNGAGAPKLAIAETVLAFILADVKTLHGHFVNQQAKVWKRLPHRELPGLSVAVLGLGKIGLEVAQLCKALGMRVIGTKRTVSGQPLPAVDRVYSSEQMKECVAEADFVVVASALTPETRGMVGDSVFEAMKPDAVLINIARGAIVDEGALQKALRAGTIRGAYLDVFAEEPLPADSPLYELPNLVITPHNSPVSQNVQEHMVGVFLENFRRYCAGEPLLNVVDKRRGY